jgi:hypothetical protein
LIELLRHHDDRESEDPSVVVRQLAYEALLEHSHSFSLDDETMLALLETIFCDLEVPSATLHAPLFCARFHRARVRVI